MSEAPHTPTMRAIGEAFKTFACVIDGNTQEGNELRLVARCAERMGKNFVNEASALSAPTRGPEPATAGVEQSAPAASPNSVIARDVTTAPPPAAQAERLEAREQDAFEEWAASVGHDMTQHPIHYLFLSGTTYAARTTWKAAIEWATKNGLALDQEGYVRRAPVAQQTGAKGGWTHLTCWPYGTKPRDVKVWLPDGHYIGGKLVQPAQSRETGEVVKRLRLIHHETDKGAYRLTQEAADEIVRLGAENAGLRQRSIEDEQDCEEAAKRAETAERLLAEANARVKGLETEVDVVNAAVDNVGGEYASAAKAVEETLRCHETRATEAEALVAQRDKEIERLREHLNNAAASRNTMRQRRNEARRARDEAREKVKGLEAALTQYEAVVRAAREYLGGQGTGRDLILALSALPTTQAQQEKGK